MNRLLRLRLNLIPICSFSSELTSLHARLTDAEAARQKLEHELQCRYGVSLVVRYDMA